MEENLEIILTDEEELIDITLEDEESLLNVTLENDIIEVIPTGLQYKGEYEITPLAYQEQEFETKDKYLQKNIKVKEIPFFETSNLYGNTVYIGSEV